MPLLCGVWPLLVPVGAPLGDVPHFSAILGWGLCWVALGLVLRGSGAQVPSDGAAPARASQQ